MTHRGAPDVPFPAWRVYLSLACAATAGAAIALLLIAGQVIHYVCVGVLIAALAWAFHITQRDIAAFARWRYYAGRRDEARDHRGDETSGDEIKAVASLWRGGETE